MKTSIRRAAEEDLRSLDADVRCRFWKRLGELCDGAWSPALPSHWNGGGHDLPGRFSDASWLATHAIEVLLVNKELGFRDARQFYALWYMTVDDVDHTSVYGIEVVAVCGNHGLDRRYETLHAELTALSVETLLLDGHP